MQWPWRENYSELSNTSSVPVEGLTTEDAETHREGAGVLILRSHPEPVEAEDKEKCSLFYHYGAEKSQLDDVFDVKFCLVLK